MKARLLTLAALLIGLVACQNDPTGLDILLGEGIESVITVSLPDATRGDSADGGLGNITLGEQYRLRYILEIYAVNEETNEAITTSCQRHIKVAETTSVALPVRLAPGYDYQFAVWADFVDKDSDGSVDRYYKTTDGDKNFGLYALSIIENDETKWNAMDESRDAFTTSQLIKNFSSASTITLNLERPFAKLRVVATDIEAIKAVGLKPKAATVQYDSNTKLYRQYNVVTKTVSDAQPKDDSTIIYDWEKPYYTDAQGEFTAFADYFFVAEGGGIVKFTLKIYGDDAKTKLIKGDSFNTDIAVAANQLTTLKGNLLTVGGEVEVEVTEEAGTTLEHYVAADNTEELKNAFDNAPIGENEKINIVLNSDVDLDKVLYVASGSNVNLNLNEKTINVSKASKVDPVFETKAGSTFILDGNGTIEIEDSYASLLTPRGNVIIENGTFIRKPAEQGGKTGAMFIGISSNSSSVTINGGYFDSGYYDENAAYIEEYLAGTKTLEETEDDIKKRGNSGDKNKVRVALKENVSCLLNRSTYTKFFHIYGGTFVGANPAWGDEGCALPKTPQYLRPWSNEQGQFLVGQGKYDDGIVLPEGYTITKGTHEDGRPTYTVTYNKPTAQE
ncbi:MAG: hypothetical protein IKW36_05860 [Alistipes sp.]|nr:hypothetical protein [Alistipes sp.]